MTEERKSRPSKKYRVESETVDKVETAKAAPSETKAENENSTVSSASGRDETSAKKVETAKSVPAEAQMENEHSTISTANLAKAEERQIEAAKADPNVGCKKFFPTVGMNSFGALRIGSFGAPTRQPEAAAPGRRRGLPRDAGQYRTPVNSPRADLWSRA